MGISQLAAALEAVDKQDSPETIRQKLQFLSPGILPELLLRQGIAYCSERHIAHGEYWRRFLRLRLLAELGAEERGGGGRVNFHQCLASALKHLASALVIAGEMQTGYANRRYALYLLGNLNEAQEQCAVRLPPLANRIRDFRLRLFGESGMPEWREDSFAELLDLAAALQAVVEDLRHPEKRTSGCGCRRQSD